ncbi:MAG: hypothetical protein KJS91_10410, partial [Planctomycetes bacterium]|nr:hypothetical protein [Planctomycetota bacterium]
MPGLGDSATIDRGAANPTITITDDRTISNLDLREKLVIQSGTVVCAGPWSLAGDSSFTSTLEIAQGGTMALRGGSVGGDYRPAFTNAGTIIVGSGNQNLSSMPLTNLPTGVISWEDGATLLGNSHLINQGTFLKPAGTGTSALTKTWSNRGGTIQVDAGTLEMTNTMADVSGMQFVVAQGAKAFLSGDLRNWSGVISGTGSGLVQFGDANRRATVTLSTNDSSPADATFNFSPGMAHITNCWIQSIGVPNVPNGVLSNQGTLVFDQSASDIRLTTALTINNSGSMIIANAAGSSMYLQTTTIINTGLIDFTNNSTVTIGLSSATIQNRGRLLKSAGSGVTTVGGVIMRPEGTVESRAGTLELRGFGGAPASTGSAFAASNGATILLTENHYLQGTYSGTGLGTVQIGTADTSYPNAFIRVEQAGASLNFTDSILHFVRGSIYSDNIQNVGFSTITNNGIISIDGGEANFSGFASINNPGSIIVSASGQLRLFNATLRNQTGGLLEFRGGGGAVGSGVIDNRGILRQLTGLNATISTPVILRKEGFVDVVAGVLDLAGDNSVLEGGSYQVAAGGELKATGFSPTLRGDFTGSGGGRFTLTRDMNLEGASFDFPAGMVRFTGGSLTAANNGRAEFVNRGFMTIASGGSRQRSAFTRTDLRNLGTITVNDAEWLPDGSTTIDNRGTINLSDGAIVLRSTG